LQPEPTGALRTDSCHPRDTGWTHDPARRGVTIHIGALHASRKPTVVYTLLGSCVGVCLYDPVARIGGMNHILLPGRADLKHFDASARYGINAMELLINKILRLGGNRDRLLAKAFGGAHILPAISPENGTGRKNIEFVLEFLKMEKIHLVSHDFGGRKARQIYFYTDTGEVLLKRVARLNTPAIGAEEQMVLERARRKALDTGAITLFTEE
jgi:chemotaxis protein CheD